MYVKNGFNKKQASKTDRMAKVAKKVLSVEDEFNAIK
jgi:hypothetical protein